jgi:hypothetical protein
MQASLAKSTARAARPFRGSQRCAVPQPRMQRVVAARAEEQQAGSVQTETAQAPASTSAPAGAPQQPAQEAPKAPVLVKGQGTAIITGAISILFGVAYLALQIFMDSRGGQMLPPPPEALIP